MHRYEDETMILGIESTWSDDDSIGVWGWLISKVGPLDRVELELGGESVPITSWHARPDLAAIYRHHQPPEDCGFWVQASRPVQHRLTFRATRGGYTWKRPVTAPAQAPPVFSGFPDGSDLYDEFVRRVNEEHLSVLEIGSRVVCPGGRSQRDVFSGASSYTGFDFHPDANTDVVGDAHELSRYFPERRFDAVFSRMVLEHLAMPWVVAREINKVLAVGGITFHDTVFAWPLHARPWDFWRFSEDGLKVLFSPYLGFETVAAGLSDPVSIHLRSTAPGQESFPVCPAFAGVAILARKTHDCDQRRCSWEAPLAEVLGVGSAYPLA
jgi:hypothetical protein